MAATLPGSDLTQAQLDQLIAVGPAPEETWNQLFLAIHPVGLTEVPIWYVTVVTAAVKAGHITETDAEALLTAIPSGQTVSEPRSLLTAWADLMDTLAVLWPRRRRLAAAQLDRMNVAVAHAQRTFSRG